MAHLHKRCQLCPETGANYVVQPVTLASSNFYKQGNCTACGNCNAIYQLLGTDRDGMIHFKIGHDETCPWLTAAEAEAEKS